MELSLLGVQYCVIWLQPGQIKSCILYMFSMYTADSLVGRLFFMTLMDREHEIRQIIRRISQI